MVDKEVLRAYTFPPEPRLGEKHIRFTDFFCGCELKEYLILISPRECVRATTASHKNIVMQLCRGYMKYSLSRDKEEY